MIDAQILSNQQNQDFNHLNKQHQEGAYCTFWCDHNGALNVDNIYFCSDAKSFE